MLSETQNGRLDFCLFGRFSVTVDGERISGLDGRRQQELLGFLVINRDRTVTREALSETLWPESHGDSRRTLRQALWQVHSAFSAMALLSVLTTDNGYVGLHPDADVRADVIELEQADKQAHASPTGRLTDAGAESLRAAASLYRGDLLQNSYASWCLVERERFRAMYLAILDKLMVNAELAGNIDEGLWYGEQVLRHDRASERTHRRLMVLRYLAGDRTGAMRQYESCARALADELDVSPGPSTRELDGLIRRGQPLPSAADPRADPDADTEPPDQQGTEALHILRKLHKTLHTARDQLAAALDALGDSGPRQPEDG
jgi:DNA-binding SARP family transcriptional activator